MEISCFISRKGFVFVLISLFVQFIQDITVQSAGKASQVDLRETLNQAANDCAFRGFHVGDARLGDVRIFDARVKIQHDAQWRVSNDQSRPITHF